ncbi:Fic family protein [Oceanobacter kriegii]|uniref:Fic family protein n=1 Tax=Oceanobacter kriegii TaxID=64972 RepID=UPI00048495EB|nr:Fic family protein [Oceanobacter kriegii]
MQTHWIWQHSNWPDFHWDEQQVQPLLRSVRMNIGVLIGKTGEQTNPAQSLDTLLANVLSSSAIEGEKLDARSVRSSLARRIGVDEQQPSPVSEQSEGIAQIMVDAIHQAHTPLTLERLFQWHHWLFPAPETMILSRPEHIGELRGDSPMQVVSGREDNPTVHFEAPPRDVLTNEVERFIDWFNSSSADALLDPLLRAALVHLWFVTLHPFDDGNGRITRVLTDMVLAQADEQGIRLYAMSVAILERRASYYEILENTQRGDLDITKWILWFLQTLDHTISQAQQHIDRTLAKTRFWQRFHDAGLSKEQIKVLNRLLDGGENGFEDGISAGQYQKVAKVSKATATRHLADLLDKGCIEKLPGGGRSTRYTVNL